MLPGAEIWEQKVFLILFSSKLFMTQIRPYYHIGPK